MTRLRLSRWWDRLHTSYWLVPSAMAVASVAAATGALALDGALGAEWTEALGPWYQAVGPEGARTLLSTIAGSLVTVAGVSFTVTISSAVFASSQYGPRLLTNLMQDVGNRVTLGTFVSAFLYCLIVLRGVGDGDGGAVPPIATAGGVLLALASVAALIYFVHHTAHTIHVSHLVGHIGETLQEKIDAFYPDPFDSDEDGEAFERAVPAGAPGTIVSRGAGYVLRIHLDGLVRLARRRDVVLRADVRPGDFVRDGQPLASVWPEQRLNDGLDRDARLGFVLSRHRAQLQDVLFLVDELAEIAARALSPGVNDPFTARTCVDWLENALADLGSRDLHDGVGRDDEGETRLLIRPLSFDDFCRVTLDKIRPYFATDRTAALHLMQTLVTLSALVPPERRAVLTEHADALLSHAADYLSHPRDRAALREVHACLCRPDDA